jgi:hypothetical protein
MLKENVINKLLLFYEHFLIILTSSSSLWGRSQGLPALMHCGLQAYCAPLDLVPPVISRGAPRPTT